MSGLQHWSAGTGWIHYDAGSGEETASRADLLEVQMLIETTGRKQRHRTSQTWLDWQDVKTLLDALTDYDTTRRTA